MDKLLTPQDIKQILDDRIKGYDYKLLKEIPSPDLFKDMELATNRIVEAINSGETINLVGDYDVDGVISTAIMIEFFNFLNININHIIPNRFDHGYGLSPKILDHINDGLIITVDNGISAYEAADICKKRGLDLIITDHHTVGDKLPEAYAIVNPKQSDCNYPFEEICGAQVAWYLCASIKNKLKLNYNLMELFDLLSLAIVADIMPMVSLNQTIVKHGLNALSRSNRVSIKAIKERFYIQNFNEEDIGFKLAPLINCAGRMSDASIALEFLLSRSQFEANENLEYLIELNETRKQDQLNIFNEAKLQVNEDDKVIVVASENWNEGIIGIVASKLCEKYKKPAFVFTIKDDIAKASSRSTSDVHLYELIDSCKDLVLGFGGHKQAAGLSCETSKLKLFKEALNKNIKTQESKEPTLDPSVLGQISLCDVDSDIYNLIESYRPFGQDNRYPVFLFKNIDVINVNKIGKNKEYMKLMVSNGKSCKDMLVFNDIDQIYPNTKINFIATISKNEFRGEVNYNLLLKEIL